MLQPYERKTQISINVKEDLRRSLTSSDCEPRKIAARDLHMKLLKPFCGFTRPINTGGNDRPG
jgi:hypothetical protein